VVADERDVMNAKLSVRRQERREARAVGKVRMDRRRQSGYESKTMIWIIRATTLFCGLLVSVWLLGMLHFAHHLSSYSNNLGRPSFLRNTRSQRLADSTAAVHVVTGNHPSSEMIDMRELVRTLPFANPDGGAWKQGWDVQPVDPVDATHPLTIFVVPHSHCDPGWIKTFDEYFQSQTKHILTSVVQALSKDPRRKFIWAEISYFEWWWKEQDESTRQLVRKLLQDGQLEFVTGGWVQPDEANTQLYAMEIQLQEGHDFIRETFGGEEYIPTFGWSIDPFGYSPTMAYLLEKYGFEGMLIQRVHYAVKKELAQRKHLEFKWRQTWDPSGKHDIFTHVMPFFSYDVPHTCGPDPSVCCQFDFARLGDFKNGGRSNHGGFANYGRCPWGAQPKRIESHNVAERALLLLDQYKKKANLYRSNVVIAPLGDDFRYQSLQEADSQYENYQKIFDYLNKNVPGVSIQFGTLSDYFRAAMGTFDPPILKGSFFTYSDREEDYWSGYFTSRVFDKALDRKLERVLYAATSMGATKLDLRDPRRALSLFQHHDGVTGTAKDKVVEDYAKRIHDAIHFTQDWMIKKITNSWSEDVGEKSALVACWQSDAPRGLSQNLCESSNNEIILYNPLEFDSQYCGDVVVKGRTKAFARLPCELPGALPESSAGIEFDPVTGLMTHPIKEQWMVWKVKKGGAYLFFPGKLLEYGARGEHGATGVSIEKGGFVVSTQSWKRTVVEKRVPTDRGGTAIVLDFVYETFLQDGNEEWLVRFSGDIANSGVFHTDLNGYNFDTHHYRKDMPIQSQVFPMPTLASIEDAKQRLTILSEHAQGTASLEDGSIDVWLDRRLVQDDARGLGQGVTDNVPTRTRLRVVVESEGFNHANPEFEITPLCKRMWKELNHPLEMFGRPGKMVVDQVGMKELKDDGSRNKVINIERYSSPLSSEKFVPLVYMVYNRVDYLKRAIDSLRDSDFPRKTVPIIISHDGHIQDMVSYVESIKSDFKVIQLFHPHACSEHPHTFPGDDPKLNENYKGDAYGNPREGRITCCKHHFTWLMNKVFGLDEVKQASAFFFMEEDYIVGPTVYSTLVNGFKQLEEDHLNESFFGLALDPTEGFVYNAPEGGSEDFWYDKRFVTGPMAFTRNIFDRIKKNAREYCTFDDYNWYVY
jgi:hypothetical protein